MYFIGFIEFLYPFISYNSYIPIFITLLIKVCLLCLQNHCFLFIYRCFYVNKVVNKVVFLVDVLESLLTFLFLLAVNKLPFSVNKLFYA